MNLVHTYCDPFAVAPARCSATRRAQLRRTLATLNAEIDRLEARVWDLWRQERAIPVPDINRYDEDDADFFNMAEAAYERDLDRIEGQISRLQRRIDAMAETAFDAEFELWWGRTYH